MCHFEHRLSWDEFQDLTLAQLEALEDRRAIKIRHARFNAALTTTAVANQYRGEDSEPLSPFDLIPGMEKTEEEVRHEKERKGIKQVWGRVIGALPMDVSPEEAQKVKDRLISAAIAEGFDGEEMWLEMFPED